MKTKTIFKTLALAMMMPAMMLTTACSNDDDSINNESTNENGYPLSVTINVTRQDDANTRATYSGNILSFSSGDQLFVRGTHDSAGKFAGTLLWQSSGTFSGTIYTQNTYSGTADALLNAASQVGAVLVPAGYSTYGCYSFRLSGYSALLFSDFSKAFAPTKAIAVEQFSFENSNTYSSGFALSPSNVILNFTITGLTPSTNVDVAFTDQYNVVISGKVTTDGSGTATFAIGAGQGQSFDIQSVSLTVDGNDITLASGSKTLVAGKIYNINRSAAP